MESIVCLHSVPIFRTKPAIRNPSSELMPSEEGYGGNAQSPGKSVRNSIKRRSRASKFLCQYKKSGLPNSNLPSNYRAITLPTGRYHARVLWQSHGKTPHKGWKLKLVTGRFDPSSVRPWTFRRFALWCFSLDVFNVSYTYYLLL